MLCTVQLESALILAKGKDSALQGCVGIEVSVCDGEVSTAATCIIHCMHYQLSYFAMVINCA